MRYFSSGSAGILPSRQTATSVHGSRKSTFLNLGDFLVLCVPLLQCLQVHAVGVLFGTDLLLLAALPFVLATRMNRLRNRQIAIVLLLGLAWLIAQICTDVIRGSRPEDYLRGWSKIGLTVTHLAVVWAVLRSSTRRFALYGIGLCGGGALSCLITPNEFSLIDPWKFGLAIPVTLLVIFSVSSLSGGRNRPIVLIALFAMSGVNLYLNLRSVGMICLVTGVYCYFQTQAQTARLRLGWTKMVVTAGAVLLSVWGFQQLYTYAVTSGHLGQDAQAKYEFQEQGEGGVLLGGRSEILASAQAIIDSPIIGHGSWARNAEYAAIGRERFAELGYKVGHHDEDDLIPTHSHVFGAWVESGVIGAIFWLWILKLTVGTILRVKGNEPLLPVFAFIAFLLCWDILFSPYGADRRFMATYFIAVIVWVRSFGERSKYAAILDSRI